MVDIDIIDPQTEQATNDLAERIRVARKDAHLSQDELGRFIGVSDKSVSAYEQGRSTPPISKLKKIAEYTNHPLSFFTQEENSNALIASKLASIERELIEVKNLLLSKKQI